MIINRQADGITSSSDPEEIAQAGLLPQMRMMIRALWASSVRNALLALSGSLFLIIAATAYGQIRLNSWNQPFYDALSHRNFMHFLRQFGVFGIIAGALLVLNVAQRWFGETLKLKLREGLTHDLVENWMAPGRAFRLANAGAMAGKNLIGRNAERYAREADMRFSLVRVNEHIDAIALAGGEQDEARRIVLDLNNVLRATRLLVTGTTNLTWITAGYGWFTLVAPILVAAPLYFAGSISFGGLMMASGAFIQVQSSLRWFVDNFTTIADWRATPLRVASFRRAVVECDVMHDVASRIEFTDGEPGRLTIDDLEITSPGGTAMLAESHVEMKSGERVRVVAETGTGKTLLFRALAGLSPWGAGRVARPRGESTLYIPRPSYFPPGTLREVLAYPSEVARFTPDACAHALERLGLERLRPLLEESRRWEAVLSDGELQRLAFARALLHTPVWLVIDEALEALEEDALPRVREMLTQDLKRAGVLYIGRTGAQDSVFGRVIHLVNDPEGRRLPPRSRPQAVTAGSLG